MVIHEDVSKAQVHMNNRTHLQKSYYLDDVDQNKYPDKKRRILFFDDRIHVRIAESEIYHEIILIFELFLR